MKTTILILSSLALISACSDGADVSDRAKQPIQSSTAAQQAVVPQQATQQPMAKSGIVKNAHVAGGYSYLETDINGQTVWIATAATSISPGEEIAWNDSALMKNFTSKAMGRTFDQIMFIDRVSKPGEMADNQHHGTVLEVENASGYSYILAQEANRKVWLAAPQMIIDVGQQIQWTSGQPMRNFSSRSLDRTFPEIYFVNSVEIDKG